MPRDAKFGSPRFKAGAYPFYARLRAEQPVHRVPLPGRQTGWLITRYDDVAAVLKDERFVKEGRDDFLTPEQKARRPWVPGFFAPLSRNMLALDPPAHTRLRALVHQAFTPRFVETLRGWIEGLTVELLDRVARRGRMELIRDYARPLPTSVIAQMLGISPDDRRRFHRWSSAIVSADTSGLGILKSVPAVHAFLKYLRKLVASRRANPRDDLVSALVLAREAGDKLSEDELLGMIFVLIVAGHETSVNLIGNGMLALLSHRDQWDRLRAEPQLLKPAIEELLRYESPLESATKRFAREDVTVAGVRIARGELVYAVLASANRDERHFPDPDRLDISRDPNRHIAFGLGAHFCLGAPLARLEGQIAIQALVRRFPDLRLAVPPEKLRWRRSMMMRGLEALPVEFALGV